jgi:glycosyltransferase involved in cell wall biosynthesis
LPNIHLLGHRPYAVLPAYVKSFDVAVIPYRVNAYTRAVFPIKFFEFLGSGKPVVISDLPALAEYWDAVLVARDADEFLHCCERALVDTEAARERRLALASKHTWETRVAELMQHVEARLAGD